MRRYTKEHAWVFPEGELATLGITDYAQRQLGDIVYVDLPKPGTLITAGQPMGTVESVKSVSELVAPITGTVTEVNSELAEQPEKLNQDPEGGAWLMRVKITAPAEVLNLLDTAAYLDFVKET